MKIHIETPLQESTVLSQKIDGNIWLKMESLQPSGSFKARGVGYACQQYVSAGAKSLVASSGGNAGLAVAYAGRRLKVPVTVVVPTSTKQRAINLIELEQAQVIVKGGNWNEAHQYALSLMNQESAYIHPYDDPYLWAGHASIIDEIKAAGVQPDAIVLAVGGGGLLCGVVEGLVNNSWSDVPILAVETRGADSLYTAAKAKKHIGIDAISSIATSLGAVKVSDQAFKLLDRHPIVPRVVSDQEALTACFDFLYDHRVMVEPACGASLATVYQGDPFLQSKSNIVVIVCGGVGVSLEQLKLWQAELI